MFEKKFLFVFTALLGLSLMACQSNSNTQKEGDAVENDGKTFGTGVSNPDAAVAFTDVVKQLDNVDSVNVVMKAKVTDVCQVKGCWMKIIDPVTGSETASADELFVQFKDYGFFMPKDLSGHTVIMEGVAYKDETSVEELKHYAEDEKKSPEEIAAITEPLVEKKLMASGVVILD